MIKKKSHAKKKIPHFWWDFGQEGEIIVESDSDKYPICGIFRFETNNYTVGEATKAIEQAEELIKDLREGRQVPQNLKTGNHNE